MKKVLFSLAVLSLVLFSCKNTSNNSSSDSDSTVVEEGSTEGGHKYGMSKGMVKYTMDIMGMSTTSVLWFDDYGQKECMETSAEIMGMKSNSRSFKKEGYAYNINMEAKTGTKMKIVADQFDPTDMQFDKMTEEVKTKYNFKEEGSDKFLGKDCKVYTMDYQGSKGKFWVWDNIALKYEMSQSGMKIEMKAIEISENPRFPAAIFDVPEGITVTETSLDDAMKGMSK
jgi:hypothetical protein